MINWSKINVTLVNDLVAVVMFIVLVGGLPLLLGAIFPDDSPWWPILVNPVVCVLFTVAIVIIIGFIGVSIEEYIFKKKREAREIRR